MNAKIISLSFVLVTALTLSACTIKDQLKTKVLDKVDQKVQQEKAENVDDQLLNEMQKDDSLNIDSEFSRLDQELK